MNLDELKQAWETSNRRLDTVVSLNRQVVIASMLKTVKTPMQHLRIALSMEAVSAFAITLSLGNFIFRHSGEPGFAWPAALMDVWMIGLLVTTIRQLVFMSTIHYDQPVLDIQKRIENLRLLRLRSIRFALITGLVVWWLPFLIVVCKAVFNIDAYMFFGERFFYINGLASGMIVPLSIWLSKRFSQRMARSPFFQSVARHIEGNYVDTALASMARISAFEVEVAA